jgi:hypothetical protein
MPRKPQRPRETSDPEQLRRFIETAREVEVDEHPDAFDRAFGKVVKRTAPAPSKPLGRRQKTSRGA